MSDENSPSGTAIAGLLLSAFGLLGWLGLIAAFEPYEPNAVQNVFAFGLNAILLLAGGGFSAALCLSGVVASSVSNSHAPSRLATLGTILGGLGLAVGVAVLSWRWGLVFG